MRMQVILVSKFQLFTCYAKKWQDEETLIQSPLQRATCDADHNNNDNSEHLYNPNYVPGTAVRASFSPHSNRSRWQAHYYDSPHSS